VSASYVSATNSRHERHHAIRSSGHAPVSRDTMSPYFSGEILTKCDLDMIQYYKQLTVCV